MGHYVLNQVIFFTDPAIPSSSGESLFSGKYMHAVPLKCNVPLGCKRDKNL